MLRTIDRTASAALGSLALLATVAACSAAPGEPSGGEPSREGIATLETSAPAPTESVDPLFAEYGEPVRLRLDMTDEEGEAAWQARERCLEDHYPALQRSQEGGDGPGAAVVDDPAEAAEAEVLCMRLAPLPPWELDAQNPDALRFAQLVVDCLREQGVREVEITQADEFGQINFALGGEVNDPASISLGLQHMAACQRTASERSAG